ncbi:MAG: hypothetical protein OEY38_23035, partial [Gammaproteobacteria bacterium]|nr:hypothetical protein [Gammaproteobacteria bacterium]
MSKRKQSPNLIHYFFSIIAISIMSVGFVALSIFPAFQNPEKFFANDAGYWVNVCWLALSYSAYFSSPLISMIYYLDFCTCSEKAVKLITLSSIGWFFIILIAPFLVYTIFQVHDFIDWSSIGILV